MTSHNASALAFAPSHVPMCHHCGEFEIGMESGGEDEYCGGDCARKAEAEDTYSRALAAAEAAVTEAEAELQTARTRLVPSAAAGYALCRAAERTLRFAQYDRNHIMDEYNHLMYGHPYGQ